MKSRHKEGFSWYEKVGVDPYVEIMKLLFIYLRAHGIDFKEIIKDLKTPMQVIDAITEYMALKGL